MKNFYIAVTVEQNKNMSIFNPDENKETNPGLYAYVIKINSSNNLKSALECIGGLVHANIFPTKKDAEHTVNYWNDCYKANGTYLFDSAPKF